jgi:hypothetical protein
MLLNIWLTSPFGALYLGSSKCHNQPSVAHLELPYARKQQFCSRLSSLLLTKSLRLIGTLAKLSMKPLQIFMASYSSMVEAKLFGDPIEQSVCGQGVVNLDGREPGPFGLLPEAIGEQPVTYKQVLERAFRVAGLPRDALDYAASAAEALAREFSRASEDRAPHLLIPNLRQVIGPHLTFTGGKNTMSSEERK